MATASPKTITIYGRLSFPQFTAQEAFDRSQGSQYPAKSVAEAKPSFQLIVEQPQFDKIKKHIVDVFLPYCIQQEQAGEKRDVLSAAEVKDILKQIDDPSNWEKGVFNTPFKPVHEKTQALAPAAVATVKCIGNEGVDVELKAIVNSESDFADPALAADQLKWPDVKPVNQTVYSFYPGCQVAVTINLYAYHNGKLPGFSAGVSVAVFKADDERFGGGVAVDEDAIFSDD